MTPPVSLPNFGVLQFVGLRNPTGNLAGQCTRWHAAVRRRTTAERPGECLKFASQGRPTAHGSMHKRDDFWRGDTSVLSGADVDGGKPLAGLGEYGTIAYGCMRSLRD
ncbi:hypothetical protein GY45DRAFT_1323990 [Cubamyces sp. BRFM 1775]|nr:hypothetical protein GY45DRAFT_1323990 [Cubamyces sp. BRFM 1775]